MSEPYYKDENVTIYHGDCLDVMPDLPSWSVHACVTDPPYILQAGSSIVRGSKTGGWADMMNASLWYSRWLAEVSRLVREDGSIWSFLGWRTLPVMARAAIDAGLSTSSFLVWDKEVVRTAPPAALRTRYEMCLLMPQPGFKVKDRSAQAADVYRLKTGFAHETDHPAEKPVVLMEHILRLCSLPDGATVIDPFAGSGSVLLAARRLGLHAIGIEAEERWCEAMAGRLSQGVLDDTGAEAVSDHE